jgi:ABC-type transport system substrate-binding protein
VKLNYDKTRASLLTGLALGPLKETQVVDDLTVKFVMSQPWANFPRFLTDQVGVIAAPAQYNDKAHVSDHPIGTGPFMFKEWVKGDHLTVVKNPNYWQKGLPHLDQITYRVIPEEASRFASLQSGQIDIAQDDDEDNIVKARNDGTLKSTESKVDESTFVLINTLQPGPLSDVRIRQALAYATDREQYNKLISKGIREVAEGPWAKDSKWYTPTGFPNHDIAKAKDLVAQYQKDHPGAVTFKLGLTPSPGNVKAAALLQAQWKEAGINVDLKQTEQATYINDAVFGKFEANTWRQFGASDPDVDYIWWHSQNAKDIGQIAINFARFRDPANDKALDDARVTADEAKRKEDYAIVAKEMAKEVPYIWLNHVVWSAIHVPRVHDITVWKLPDGSTGRPRADRFELAQLWVDK